MGRRITREYVMEKLAWKAPVIGAGIGALVGGGTGYAVDGWRGAGIGAGVGGIGGGIAGHYLGKPSPAQVMKPVTKPVAVAQHPEKYVDEWDEIYKERREIEKINDRARAATAAGKIDEGYEIFGEFLKKRKILDGKAKQLHERDAQIAGIERQKLIDAGATFETIRV